MEVVTGMERADDVDREAHGQREGDSVLVRLGGSRSLTSRNKDENLKGMVPFHGCHLKCGLQHTHHSPDRADTGVKSSAQVRGSGSFT